MHAPRQRSLRLLAACLSVVALHACGDGGKVDEPPVVPTATITFPPPLSRAASETITVTGVTEPAGAARELRVNGALATTADGYAHWQAQVALNAVENPIVVTTVDHQGVVRTAAHARVVRGSVLRWFSSVAIDAPRNRLLLVDTDRQTLVAYDRSTGLSKDLVTLVAQNPFNFDIPGPFNGNMGVDPLGERAFVLGFLEIFPINLVTGRQETPTLYANMPQAWSVDTRTNSAYVSLANDPVEFPGGNAIHRYDLATLNPSVVSRNGYPYDGDPFFFLGTSVFDPTRERVLAANGTGTMLAVDLATGARTPFASATLPNGSNPFFALGQMAIDAARNRVLVADAVLRAVIEVDPVTGARTHLPINPAGVTPANLLGNAGAVTIDAQGNRALVIDARPGAGALVAVDLDTAEQTLISGPGVPDAIEPFVDPRAVAFDARRNRALVIDRTRLLAVDLATGARRVVTFSNGGGVSQSALGLVYNAPQDRAYIIDGTVVKVADFGAGTLTVFADGAGGNGVSIAADFARDRVLVLHNDGSPGARIMSVDINDGSRRFYRLSRGYGAYPRPAMIGADVTAPDRVGIIDCVGHQLNTVALGPLTLSLLSSRTAPDMADAWQCPTSLAQHPTRGYWVVGDYRGRLFAADPQSGRRVTIAQ